MKLALSVRIAETDCKTKLTVPPDQLFDLAVSLGYSAVCMRASAAGIGTPREELRRIRESIQNAGLTVSMVTADFDVPLNNDNGPASLKNITPTLDVAESLGSDLVRVCLKKDSDIPAAQRAADEAAERNIRLAHQCHTTTLFETVDSCVSVLKAINRSNFGIIYEPANLMLCGQPYGEETLKRLSPWLMNVYVQNHRLDPDGPESLETWCLGMRTFHHLPIWESGGVNFPEVIRALKAIHYQGHVTVHQAYANLMGPEDAASGTAQYLRQLIAE
ncbi:MAG: sugar phosphate isomerase/epimerase family protein [Planctomyces sp.]